VIFREENKTDEIAQLEKIKTQIDVDEGLFLSLVGWPNGKLLKEVEKSPPDWGNVSSILKQGERCLNGLLASLEKLKPLKFSMAGLMAQRYGVHLSAKERMRLEYNPGDNSYSVKVFNQAEDYYVHLEKQIRSAQYQVLIEVYIFWPDEVGKYIAKALIDKAKEFSEYNRRINANVSNSKKVVLMFDGFGSMKLFYKGSKILEEMRKAGVEIRIFNPPRNTFFKYNAFSVLRHPLISMFGRNHRKVCIIDEKMAYLGGINFGDEDRLQRDTHLCVVGSPVPELVQSYLNILSLCQDYEENYLSKISQERKEKTKEWISGSRLAVHKPSQRRGFKILANAPSFREHAIRDEYLKFIRGAERSIYLTCPYFSPGRRFIRELGKAVERGVEVKIIFPLRTDHSSADAISRSYFKKLLEKGVQIFLYNKPGIMFIHAKTLVVDGKYGTVGSSNLDYVSLSMNCEINFFFANISLAQELENQFKDDLRYCKEVSLTKHLEEIEKEGILQRGTTRAIASMNSLIAPRQAEYQ
jgi:cardiolipin synthase